MRDIEAWGIKGVAVEGVSAGDERGGEGGGEGQVGEAGRTGG